MTASDGKGNGKGGERRTGVDRRISRNPSYGGTERRNTSRRRSERSPDKPVKR